MKNLMLGLLFLGALPAFALEWVSHPCPIKGAPFKKYALFAIANGEIHAKANAESEDKTLQDKPKGGGAWTSITHFFDDKGITEFCGGAPSTAVPAVQTHPEKPQASEPLALAPFQAPLNPGEASYYTGIDLSSPSGFRQSLHNVLSKPHLENPWGDDELVDECPKKMLPGMVCVRQRKFNYEQARRVMMGDESLGDLRKDARGEYEIFDYYCQEWMGRDAFSKVANTQFPGPDTIVHVKLMNCEHTWPQSKFPDDKESAKGLEQKTDLHHIFPTNSKVNAERGNHEFAEVEPGAKPMLCSDGKLGKAKPIGDAHPVKGEVYFEPPTAHKGNTARALFYFSIRYNAGMSKLQESYLRKWNREDPPDEREIKRNEAVYMKIGVRNPFVDHPEWADRIDSFCRVRLTESQAATPDDCK